MNIEDVLQRFDNQKDSGLNKINILFFSHINKIQKSATQGLYNSPTTVKHSSFFLSSCSATFSIWLLSYSPKWLLKLQPLTQYSNQQESKKENKKYNCFFLRTLFRSSKNHPVTCYWPHLRNLAPACYREAENWFLSSGQGHHVAQLQGGGDGGKRFVLISLWMEASLIVRGEVSPLSDQQVPS